MGNVSSMARASTALDSYVAELGNDISYDKSLSSSRFLKTILARHAYGPLVLKIFIKPEATMSLRSVQRRLKSQRDALGDLPGINTYQTFVETEKAGYLIRQWVGSNLYDRVSTQPYLADIEKKWIAFQLLTCLRDSRTRKVAHGDIKSENVLITSDLTVLLTDFSSALKPTYLPLDDPSDFSYFFDTSTRRTCYIAPERFYAAESSMAEQKRAMATAAREFPDSENWGKRDGKITEEMDVFSTGCVLAEMWTDGRTVFNLSELYAYRDGSLGLNGILDNIDDEEVKSMISLMLSRSPEIRPNFDRILSTFRGTIFPEYFYTFLKDYCNSLSELPDSSELTFPQRAAAEPGNKIDRLLNEWDSVSIHLEGKDQSTGPALLLLNIVTSSLRNSIWPSSRLHGLQLFLNLCPYLSDEDKVDRIVPFVVELLADEVAIVRAEACRSLVIVVDSIKTVTPQNSTFIPEYLLPQIRQLASDPDVFVRTAYARGLVRLAESAVNMLEMSHAAKPTSHVADNPDFVEPDYDTMLQEIQSLIEEQATTLLVDPSSNVKRAMLSSIPDLCLFFGRQKSNETVLSHIMTYLNDRDWLLRLAFFDGIVGVGAFIGIKAIEEYVLPLMLQALADSEEAVVAKVIGSLSSLASLGLLPRMRVWDVFFAVRGFLCHPNIWIRQNTAGFIAAAAKSLPYSDVWCILYPSVRTLLHSDVLDLDEDSLISAIVPPLSRATLVAAKMAALQNSPPGFWDLPQQKGTAKSTFVKAANGGDQSEAYQLRDKGISEKDERKVVALKEFIVKQAHANRARESSDQSASVETALTTGKSVSLTDLGVTPQTVFISPRTVGVDAKMDIRRLRADLIGSSSRRTSFASRSNRGGIEKPLDEIRKRLVSLEIPSRIMENQAVEPIMPPPDASPSDSLLSSTLDLSAIPHGRRKGDSKAAPAIGAVHTNAVATTTIHDDAPSGRSTPTILTSKGPIVPYSSSYEGQDPGVRAFLEQVDLDNYREPLLDFGPRVVASNRKKGPRLKTSSTPQTVTLIAHLTQHSGAVSAIVPSPDHLFFATSSEDGQVLVWDTAKLERSVAAKPRLSYRMDAPVTTMCRIENTHCLAVASEDGQVHVLRVHVAPGNTSAKYGKIEMTRTWRVDPQDGYVTFISHLQDSSLLILTSTSVIAQLDIRTMQITTRFQHPLELGLITAFCPSGQWIVVGTSTGTLSLWDLRFGLLLKSWKASAGITSCQLHPAKGKGRWIMVGIDRKGLDSRPMVEVYDIETSRLMEVYEARSTKPLSKSAPSTDTIPDDIPDKAKMIAELATSSSIAQPLSDTAETSSSTIEAKNHSVLSLMVGHGFAALPGREEDMLMSVPEAKSLANSNPGWMVTAGEDRVIRYWDLARPSEGFVICGSAKEKDVSFKHTGTSVPSMFYTLPTPHRQSLGDARHPLNAQRQPLRPHYDAICALGTVETPFSSCVVSADRSGVIKVWRMEGSTART